MLSKRKYIFKERPDSYIVNRDHPLCGSLAFANFGGDSGGFLYRDDSGKGNHGTLTGYTGAGNLPQNQWSRALGRAALGFNGSTDYIPTGANLATSGFTVISQCNFTFPTNNTTYLFGGTRNADGVECGAWKFTTNAWYFNVHNATSDHKLEVGASISGWHSQACWYDGSTMRMFIDGAKVGSDVAAASTWTNTAWFVGRNAGGNYMAGSLADVMVFNMPLPTAVIAHLADPGNVMLDTGGSTLLLPQWSRVWAVSSGRIFSQSSLSGLGSGGSLLTNPLSV